MQLLALNMLCKTVTLVLLLLLAVQGKIKRPGIFVLVHDRHPLFLLLPIRVGKRARTGFVYTNKTIRRHPV